MAEDNAQEDRLPAINKQRQKQILLYFCILYYASFEANIILFYCLLFHLIRCAHIFKLKPKNRLLNLELTGRKLLKLHATARVNIN